MNFAILILSFLSFLGCSWGFLESDSWLSVQLHHALDYNHLEHFTYRGNVSILSLNSGQARLRQVSLSQHNRETLKMLAEANEFYRLKADVTYADGTTATFLTATKACNMLVAQLNDIIWLTIDSNGFVNSITQTVYSLTPMTEGSCNDGGVELATSSEFNTDILVRHTELAPIPDTASFIQKIEREREARERGDQRDNRGFFAKYWMYIVPVVLLLFISSATNQEAGK